MHSARSLGIGKAFTKKKHYHVTHPLTISYAHSPRRVWRTAPSPGNEQCPEDPGREGLHTEHLSLPPDACLQEEGETLLTRYSMNSPTADSTDH